MEATNKVQLVGWLINEIFSGTFKDGRLYAKISVATTHTDNQTKRRKRTTKTLHTVWINNMELLENYWGVLTTGSHVLVEGTLSFSEYVDKHGVRWQSINTVATRVQDLDH